MNGNQLNMPPDYVPTYDGEIAAIAHVEAHGYRVFSEVSGFGMITPHVAIHQSNRDAPVLWLQHVHMSDSSKHEWWWRPMLDDTNPPHISWSPNRVKDFRPRTVEQIFAAERQP